MALKTRDIPRPTWELFYGSWVVGGDRDVLILGSTGDSQDPDVSFRFDAELTEDDRRKLSNQGVPEECCDDLSIFRARAKLDKTYHLVGEEVSKPGRELDQSYILGRVEDLMKKSDKPGGEESVKKFIVHHKYKAKTLKGCWVRVYFRQTKIQYIVYGILAVRSPNFEIPASFSHFKT